MVVTLLAVPMGYIGWQAKIMRERKALQETQIAIFHPASVVRQFEPSRFRKRTTIPWIRKLLGDEAMQVVSLRRYDAETIARLRAAFPEADLVP